MQTAPPSGSPKNFNTAFWVAVAVAGALLGFIVGLSVGNWLYGGTTASAVNLARVERLRQEREAAARDCRQPVVVNSPEIDGRCAVRLRDDETSDKVVYEDDVEPFSLDVPFSLAWGTDRYRLMTAEKREDGYYFGRPLEKDCYWTREFFLNVTRASDEEKYLAEVRLDADTDVPPEPVSIRGLDGYQLVVSGVCRRPEVIVFGNRRAFLFGYAAPCDKMPPEKEALARLLEIAGGLHLK